MYPYISVPTYMGLASTPRVNPSVCVHIHTRTNTHTHPLHVCILRSQYVFTVLASQVRMLRLAVQRDEEQDTEGGDTGGGIGGDTGGGEEAEAERLLLATLSEAAGAAAVIEAEEGSGGGDIGGEEEDASLSVLLQVKRSTGHRSHTHTPTENNTPDIDTHAHDKNNTYCR